MTNTYIEPNSIVCGDARNELTRIAPNSVAVSVWSPPYHVGKAYEADQSYEEWCSLLEEVIRLHYDVLKPGGFLVVNIADILCFPDESMPKIQANVVSGKRCKVTREQVLKAKSEHPDFNRYQLAALLGCSEQTVQRRLEGNNVRGGKHGVQTKVKLVAGMLEDFAERAGLYLYDRRIWAKDPAWANSNWTSGSYRSVDEFEYLYIFWKPGITDVDKKRLSKAEWSEWGSRAIWSFPSVRKNDDHEAKFPVELPKRVIKLFSEPGELILDCFMGSGTSAVAAVETGRDYIGIELLPEYAAAATKRVECAAKGLLKSK